VSHSIDCRAVNGANASSRVRTIAHKYFFSNRVIQSWNSLPATSDNFSSSAYFRRFLQRTDLSRFKVGSN